MSDQVRGGIEGENTETHYIFNTMIIYNNSITFHTNIM